MPIASNVLPYRRLLIALSGFAAALLGAGEVYANPTVSECQSIQTPTERLACYDQAFPPKAAAVDNKDDATEWEIKESASAVDDVKSTSALKFAATVNGSVTDTRNAALIIGCTGDRTYAYLATRTYLAQISSVTVRLPDQAPDIETHMWDVSPDGTAIGLWEGRNPVTFIRGLKDDGVFAIRVTGLSNLEATFKLGKVSEAAQKIASACGWSL